MLLEDDEKSDDEFYTLKEMDGMENKTYAFMTSKFLNLSSKETSLSSKDLSLDPSTTKGKFQKRFSSQELWTNPP